MQAKVTVAGWGVLAAALLTLVASLVPFWSTSIFPPWNIPVEFNAWTNWWSIPVLIALAVGVVYVLYVSRPGGRAPVKPEWLFWGALASFGLMVGVLIDTLVDPEGFTDAGYSAGPRIGVWFALITALALAYFTALVAQSSGARLDSPRTRTREVRLRSLHLHRGRTVGSARA